MSNTKERIPYHKMPADIYIKLDYTDYRYALFHSCGFMRGIFEAIHMNVNYPQWHNIILIKEIDDEVVIYTENGWKKEKVENIWEQLNNEYINCFTYFYENREKIFPCLSG
jgi:hypothetical protein